MTKVSFDPITLKNMLENYGIWDQTKFDQGRRDTYDMIKKTPKNEQVTLISRKITSCMNRIQYGDCKKAWELAYWLGCLVKLDEFAHMYARPPKIDLRKRKYHEDYKIEFPCNLSLPDPLRILRDMIFTLASKNRSVSGLDRNL